MSSIQLKTIYFLLFIAVNLSFAQNALLSADAKVSVLTCGKGQELYTTFGHTALRIKDDKTQLDIVFNYGQFNFNEGNFYLKFIKGNLQYSIGAAYFTDFIYEYQFENREVVEQILQLQLTQKQQLFDLLMASRYTPDESHYTYKFIDRNCTTMVVEKINAILGAALINKVDDKKISYREVLYPKFENYFWYKLGINIIFGSKVDQPSKKLFLPIELLHSLDNLKVKGKPLVEKKQVLVQDQQATMPFSFLNSVYFVALLLLCLYFINRVFITNLYFFITGALGIFLCAVGLYSLHQELLWNYNALLFNPLFAVIPFLKNKKILLRMLILIVVSIVLYVIILINKPHLLLLLPFIICHAALVARKIKQLH